MSLATKHHWANTEDKRKNVNAFCLKSNNFNLLDLICLIS